MRKIIIDTDTASDDAVAIIMAMRSKEIKVEAITVVAGNVPLDIAINNALISVEAANTYDVPVFAGASKPMKRALETGQFAHGMNGMGDIDLPVPTKSVEQKKAIDAIIDIVKKNPYEIDIVAIGPLTNIALAINKDPETMLKVRSVYIMGGNGFGEGNMTPYAEFNYYVDAEAVKIVSEFWSEMVLLPWNTCLTGVNIDENDIDRILNIGSKLSKFVIDINQSLVKFSIKLGQGKGFILADPGIIAILIDDDIALEYKSAFLDVIVEDNNSYGKQFVVENRKSNYKVCKKMDKKKFVDLMIKLITSTS